jgi:hypothetical protein
LQHLFGQLRPYLPVRKDWIDNQDQSGGSNIALIHRLNILPVFWRYSEKNIGLLA